ncbi:class I adenylate-forming enzyme family protein [Desulfatiglans anilini]|uniref:class I adenylate-forming enzyme family protein n=1 Tax=Desulfatiglans anilini TaxID=90728 RepID=UPI000424152F|nr:AMP-binding protein [Desulfatiglans anilini]
MSTLAEMLRSTTLQHRNRLAVLDDERRLSYADFLNRVQRAAGVLRGLGLAPGARFGVIAPNTPQNAELFYGGYWSGTVPVPVNIRLAPLEMRDVLQDAGVECLFVDSAFQGLLEEEALSPWRGNSVLTRTLKGKERSYEALSACAEPLPIHPGRPDDEAIVLYTGGTTGRSKGVPLTHRNILSDALQCAPAFGPRKDDIYLHAAPMFHSADLLGTIWYLFGGAHAYMPAFSPAGLLETLDRLKITFTMLPPTMIIMALQAPDFSAYDLSNLRGMIYGASPMAVEWIRRTTKALPGVELYQGYGLTETSPLLSILTWEAHREGLETGDYERLASCGRPITGVDLRIVDEAGREVATGEAGEVSAQGPNITKGYLNRDDENRRTFRQGWFHTGDVGRKDEEGFVYLLDRKKDMVVSGGENIYTSEVEAVLYRCGGVHEAAVIGIPDETFGETLLAVIVPAEGIHLTPEEIIAHCRGKIGGYKIPRRIQFVEALPKNALGKVLKTELRRRYA